MCAVLSADARDHTYIVIIIQTTRIKYIDTFSYERCIITAPGHSARGGSLTPVVIDAHTSVVYILHLCIFME